MATDHDLVLSSGAEGGASRRTFQTAHTPLTEACFETPRLARLLSMKFETQGSASLLSVREAAPRLPLEQ
jgi:hypothetical protein